MVIDVATAFDWGSIISVVGVASIFMYIIIVYFKGMEKPPFWLYFVFGFIIVTFHSMLLSIPQIQSQTYLSVVRLIGSLLMLYGTVQLLRSYSSKIKFDKKPERK